MEQNSSSGKLIKMWDKIHLKMNTRKPPQTLLIKENLN